MVDLRYYFNEFVFVIVIMGVAQHDQRACDLCYVNNHHYLSADCCTVPVLPAVVTYTRCRLLDMCTPAAYRLLLSNVYEQLRHHKLLRRRRGCRGGRQKRASLSPCNRHFMTNVTVQSTVSTGGIPTILSNRSHVNKPHQVRRESRTTVCRVIERSYLHPQSDITSH